MPLGLMPRDCLLPWPLRKLVAPCWSHVLPSDQKINTLNLPGCTLVFQLRPVQRHSPLIPIQETVAE